MSREHINHPAFPVTAYAGDNTNPPVRPNSGMDIVKWIIGQIYPAIYSANKNEDPEVIAEIAMTHVHAILEECQYNIKK